VEPEVVLFDSEPTAGRKLRRFAWAAVPLLATVAFLSRNLQGRPRWLLYLGSAAAATWFALRGDGARERVVIVGHDVRVSVGHEVRVFRADDAVAVQVTLWELRARTDPEQVVDKLFRMSIVFGGGVPISITNGMLRGSVEDATSAAETVSAKLTIARTSPMPPIRWLIECVLTDQTK
jgi:hypothetical protein